MYYRLTSYLIFLWHSKNEHGVHSPFIFNYVTQCLYSKTKHSKNKTQNVVIKSLAYFQCQSITIVPTDEQLESQVKKMLPSLAIEGISVEFMYIKECAHHLLQTYLYDNKSIVNDTVLIIGNIHKNSNASTLWKKLKEYEKVTVTVDMYHCGAVFFRKEQVEEHFKIRI